MLKQELSDYISKARKANMSDDAIRTGLSQLGWADNDISEALSQTGPSSAVGVGFGRSMNIKKLLLTFLIVAVAAAVVYTGVAYYLSLWPFGSTSGLYAGDPAEWQTYYNEQYGFEFKYPETLEVQFNQDELLYRWKVGKISERGTDSWLEFDFDIYHAYDQDLETFVNNYFPNPGIISDQSSLHSGIYVEGSQSPNYMYFQLFPGQNYVFRFDASAEYLKSNDFKEILSTLKFIE